MADAEANQGQLRCELVHAADRCRIVMASLWQDGTCVGSALGEAPQVEEAEDRALGRLLKRHGLAATKRGGPPAISQAPSESAPPPRPEASPPPPPEEPATRQPRPEHDEPGPDPEDWSEELTAIEMELKRLSWSREQESGYLQRALSCPSRSRITRYGDLCTYLSALKRLTPGEDPATASVPLQRRELLSQSDDLLRRLGWSAREGKEWLESHFRRHSRQQLNDEQLLAFNMSLEEQWLSAKGGADSQPQTRGMGPGS